MFFENKKYPQDYLTDQTYLSGVLTGLIAGLAVGFLFAPRSGKDLRKQIAGTVGDQAKEVQHQWDKTKAQAKETIGNIKTNVGLAANKAQDELDNYADKASDKASKAADDLKAEADQAKSKLNLG